MFLFCVFAAGEGSYRGFRRLKTEQESRQGAVLQEELWFTQKLDHFNGADSREWKQVSLCILTSVDIHYYLDF